MNNTTTNQHPVVQALVAEARTLAAEFSAGSHHPAADVRLLANTLGLAAGSMNEAYRMLERSHGWTTGPTDVKRVFEALAAEDRCPSRSDVWGTKAALVDGLRGVGVEAP